MVQLALLLLLVSVNSVCCLWQAATVRLTKPLKVGTQSYNNYSSYSYHNDYVERSPALAAAVRGLLDGAGLQFDYESDDDPQLLMNKRVAVRWPRGG